MAPDPDGRPTAHSLLQQLQTLAPGRGDEEREPEHAPLSTLHLKVAASRPEGKGSKANAQNNYSDQTELLGDQEKGGWGSMGLLGCFGRRRKG